MKSNRTVCLAIAATASVLLSARIAYTQQPADDEAWKHYVFMLRSSTLEWQTSDPFLLKIDFQLYDLEGNPAEKGTAQESWSENRRRFEIHSRSLVEGNEEPLDDLKTHNRETYLVRQALLAISRPFPSVAKHSNFAMQQLPEASDPSTQCFSLGQDPLTLEAPTYCTNADNRLAEMRGQLYVLQRTKFRQYHNHEVPMEIDLSYEDKPALTAHVTELDALPSSSEANTKTNPKSSAHIPASMMSGLILKKETPKYPKEAKKKRISGSVLITAVISKQGTMTALDVVASPDPVLTKAAMDAVQRWTYRPYLLNGEPTEVDTAITVNFDLGS